MTFKDAQHIHCIGIGGIGLSALARLFRAEGKTVTGSDAHSSLITDGLIKEGIEVLYGVDAGRIPKECDLVVYTIAIPQSNKELLEAHNRSITALTYPQALGEITKNYTTIAVSGTHGKTTTTAMLASAMKGAGVNPTVIVGSLIRTEGDVHTNFIQGDSKYLVVEACEYRRSFLQLHPAHLLITNIDNDHLDYYKDLDDITSAFQEFTDKVPHDGYVITHENLPVNHPQKISADDIEVLPQSLSVLGAHNRDNAKLVLGICRALGIDEHGARKGLYEFSGTWRRMEHKKTLAKGQVIYDDYGHHPTEIKATLEAIREKFPMGKHRLFVIFQPHLYSRTKLLLDDFAGSFTLADKVCILPIYAAREAHDDSISSYDLVEKTENAINLENFEEAIKFVEKKTHNGDVILTIGAGDVYTLIDKLS